MHIIHNINAFTLALAVASKGSPVITTATVILFYLMFTLLEAAVEMAVFGERFTHWLDPIFVLAFIAYSAYAVYWCALVNTREDGEQ